MKQLSESQNELVSSLTSRLAFVKGVSAVVLGGSHARGRARPESDIDLGLFYSEANPFSIQRLRELAEEINDTPGPVVTEFYEWGPWVNGGAWLTLGGQRVDFLYRSLEHVQRVITEAEAGRYEIHYLQQPPFGFFSGTYLGEVAICIPLFDPDARMQTLKRRVAVYPDPLRRTLIRDYLFMAEFNLTSFAPKFAARSDTYGTAACLARAVNEIVMALFALNRRYPLNDKTVLAEIAEFELAPKDFQPRVQRILSNLGTLPGELSGGIEAMAALLQEVVVLANGLYQSRFSLPES